MDPVSITGLIGFSLDSIKLIYKFITCVKNASKTVSQLQQEINSLETVLGMLDTLLTKQKHVLQRTSALFKAVKKCNHELKDLQHTLDGIFKGHFVRKIFHVLKWPLDEDDTVKVVETLHRYVTVFQLSLTVDGLLLLSGSTAEVQKKLDSLNASILGIDINVGEVKNTVASLDTGLRQLIHDEEYARFLNWLPTLNHQEKHLDIESRRLQGSGQWLLDGPAFRSWSQGPTSNSTLFCHGGPGVGKSFLTSLVIDRLQDMCEMNGDKIAYLYFDYGKQSEQNPVKVVCCLLKQILCQYPSTPKPAHDLFNRFKNGLNLPQWSVILSIFVDICSDLSGGKHFIVIDALDEYGGGENRGQILRLIKALREAKVCLFATSRPFPDDIMNAFIGASIVEVGASETDLAEYLALKIKEATRLRAIMKKSLVDEITKTIIEKAQGMFLLASLQVYYVLGQTTVQEVQSALKSLPSGLWANFKHTIDRIKALPHQSQQDLAFRTLIWISHSFRVLNVKELQHAISAIPGARNISEDDLVPEVLLVEYCFGLATVDTKTSTIRLAHYSIYEYFQQQDQRELFGQAHLAITRTCLSYLTMDVFIEPCRGGDSLSQRRCAYPLADYAAHHWGNHAIKCQVDDIRAGVEKFLRNSNTLWWWSRLGLEGYEDQSDCQTNGFRAAVQNSTRNQESEGQKDKNLSTPRDSQASNDDPEHGDIFRTDITPLHVVARFSLLDLYKILPSALFGDDFNRKTSIGETPLIIASKYGQAEFVNFSISGNIGVRPNETDCTGRTALAWAVEKRHSDIVRALLELPDLDVNKGLPLLQAVKGRNLEVCVMLLNRTGLDVNASDAEGLTALRGLLGDYMDLEIGKVLLERVDLDPRASRVNNVIEVDEFDEDIMTNEELKVFPLLIRETAILCWKRARMEEGDVFLHWFTQWIFRTSEIGKHSDILLQWLNEGFDCSIVDELGFTFLHTAAWLGNEPLAKKALDLGISVSAVTKSGETPLHVATWRKGSDAVISLLLKRCTDLQLNAIDSGGSTALHNAAEAGDESVCRSLIDHGADVKAIDKRGGTTLLSAVSSGKAPIVRLFLEAGIDPNWIDNEDNSPLTWAVCNDMCDILLLLLEHGASVNTGLPWGLTPLHYAARWRNPKAARLLLEHGADPDPETLLGTPLQIAAEEMDGAVMALLISHGADPTKVGPYGRTALDWASRYEPVFKGLGVVWTQSYQPTPKARMMNTLRKTIKAWIAEMLKDTPKHYGRLGHALLFLRNYEDALTGFEKVASWDEEKDMVVHGGLECAVCSTKITGSRFVCEDCPNIDLCLPCLRKHPAGKRTLTELLFRSSPPDNECGSQPFATGDEFKSINRDDTTVPPDEKAREAGVDLAQKIPWCNMDHTFIDVPGSAWIKSKGASAQDNEAFEAWLGGLRDRYAREDELDNLEDAHQMNGQE